MIAPITGCGMLRMAGTRSAMTAIARVAMRDIGRPAMFGRHAVVLEVEARAEAAAGAGQHDRPGVVVGADLEDRVVQRLHGLEGERVHALGTVQA